MAHQSITLPTAFSTNLTDAEANKPNPYLESPVVLEGALLTRDDVTADAAAVEDVVEAVGGGAASDAVGRSRGRRQRRVPEMGFIAQMWRISIQVSVTIWAISSEIQRCQ